jgi:pyruvate/2-oxoglutarate dehydrogenase complex dihydrolipoamide acyltransferase (E2) component
MAKRGSATSGGRRRPDETAPEREYRERGGAGDDPDVLLDVPSLRVDSIHLEVDDLDAHVALKANVLDLVNLNVGVNVELGQVRIDIQGVEARALVAARLDHVAAIVDRVLTTVDRNPELLENLGRAADEIGAGAGRALEQTGGAVESLGRTAGEAGGGLGGGELARTAAKRVAKEIGAAASDEARELGVAATRKARELGERRRERRAAKRDATEAAARVAEELGVDLEEVDGSGAGGRITARDVRGAAGA